MSFFVVVTVVAALVVMLSACCFGFAFGRDDASCLPLSSVRACFWAHFVLDAFSAVLVVLRQSPFSSCDAFSLFLTLLSLGHCVLLLGRLFVSSSEAPAAVGAEHCF